MTCGVDTLGAAGSDKANYCQSQISEEAKTEGYYQNSGKDPAGEWHGEGLEALGLKPGQKVTDEDFANILRGRDLAGNDLVQGAGDKHRGGWDMTFSAPKSVSVAMACADDRMRVLILEAQNKAVENALKLVEQKIAFTRRGHAGAESEKLPGLITAQYQHIDSRNLDPQIHTHVLIMNLAQRADGTWGGIESKHFYEWKFALGAAYRAELAKGMKELGFGIEKDGDFFKIKGIDQKLCDEFSTRRKEIEAELKKQGLALGDAKTSQIAALSTRVKKNVEITRDQLFKMWQEFATKFGFDAQKINELAAEKDIKTDQNQEPEPTTEQTEPEPTIYEKLTENQSIFEEKDLYKAAAIQAQHSGEGIEVAEKIIAETLESGEIVKLSDGLMTTKNMLEIETKIVDLSKQMYKNKSHDVELAHVKLARDEFKKTEGFELSHEQKNALAHVIYGGQIALARGAAGAGKSTMLKAANSAWEKSGYTVIGAAISGKAAAGLEQGSSIKSQTIHSLLFELDQGKKTLNEKSVLVVDEAGMVGSRQMLKIIEIVEKSGAKLVLVGDERQLQPIAAGGAFKLIQSQISSYAELNEVRRQRDTRDAQAAQNIADGKGDLALADYIKRGKVKVGKTGDLTRAALVNDYIKSTTKPSEKLVLAGTRIEVFNLNQSIRAAYGLAGKGHEIQTTNGKREFAVGDRILITKNDKRLDVKNGHFGDVVGFKLDKNGELEMRLKIDGQDKVKTIKLSGDQAFENLDHGYAATVHKSQGATVDQAFFLMNSNFDKQLAYVATSRHRNELSMYASEDTIEQIYDRADIQNSDPAADYPTQKLVDAMAKNMQRDNTKTTAFEHLKQVENEADNESKREVEVEIEHEFDM